MRLRDKIINEAKKLIEKDNLSYKAVSEATGASYMWVYKTLHEIGMVTKNNKQQEILDLLNQQIKDNKINIMAIKEELQLTKSYIYKVIKSNPEIDKKLLQIKAKEMIEKINKM